MVIHDTFPQTIPLSQADALYRGSPPPTCRNIVQLYYFLLTHAPFRSITFLLIVGIELTANQCQSVCVCTVRI